MLTIYKPFVLLTIIDIYGYDREIFLLFRGLTIGLGDAGESSIQIRCIDFVQRCV